MGQLHGKSAKETSIWFEFSEMSVQRGYYHHVNTTKIGKDVSSKATKFHAPKPAVYTEYTLASSVPRAAATKPVQPKIMSPITNHSAPRRKYVTSLSVIPKEKIRKIVVLPSIDKDIAGASAKQVSGKIPVATPVVNKPIREAPKSGKGSQSQARYVSCLHTSLSTEWRKEDSLEKDQEDTHNKEKAQRTSSLEIHCNSTAQRNTTRPAARNRSSSLEVRVGDKNASKPETHRRSENRSATSLNCKNVKETANMDKHNVRIQYMPLRKSFTIKNAVSVAKTLGPYATRVQDKEPQRIRPRMLPKSRFRVKIQKCHHKSVNISDSFNVSRDKRVKPLEKSSRSVVIQDKSPQRSFSVQKPIKPLSAR